MQQGFAQDGRVLYAPDVVGVDRMFLVALKVAQDAPQIAVTVPDSVTMFDRTKLPAKTDQRKYYFRSVSPAEKAEIKFAHPDGEIIVPVVIWSYDDMRQFRELKGAKLPRRWPLGETLPELKQGRTVVSDEEIEALQKTGSPGRGARWGAMSDDDIWAMQPDSTIPRWHWVNVTYGCPVHGTEIYKDRAYYPWTKATAFPWSWKIECPVGGETYPSNDFGNGDMTSGDFPDDGIGGAYLQDGKKYGFIAETCQAYCHQMLQVAPDCARAWVATRDVKYLHKALVALSRVGVEHAYLATMTHHRHRNERNQVDRLGQSRFEEGPFLSSAGLTVYCIDQPGYQWSHAEAYDMIWADIDKDPGIIPYLQGKGFDIKTHADVRRFIEENVMAVWMQAAMDGATASNAPFSQRGLIRMAEVLNYERGDEFMDWLYDGAGDMRIFAPNTFFRDGAPYESTGGYNGMHVVAFGPIVESVEHLRQMRPEVYPEETYPALSKSRRYRSVFDFCMDTVLIDRAYPQVGDGGSHPSYSKAGRITWHSADPNAFEHAYKLFRDPKFAWALANSPEWSPSKGFPFTREEIEVEAAKWPDTWNDASSLHDGYGIAISRGGQADDKRALWMRYGMARGHNQDDLMDIGLQAYQGNILSHMGYPRNWGYWEYSWSSHNLARQFPYANQVARAQLLSDAGIAHVTEARAEAYTEFADDGTRAQAPADSWQRRMLATIDIDSERFYCVDFYRISGGEDHWWAFHCQEGDFATEGIELTKQDGGTLAGPDVPYADEKWMAENGCSKHPTYGWRGVNFVFPHLYNVEKGVADKPWYGDWNLATGEGLHVRLNVIQAEGADGEPMQVNITDGKAASGGSPYEMKWIMMHNKAETPTRSQVASVIEPYKGASAIKSTRKLSISGEDEAGFAAGAFELELDGRTDTLLMSADAGVPRTVEGGIEFAGRFGVYAESDGEPVAMSLIGGTRLMKNGLGISLDSPEYRAKIVAVDRETETITLSPAPPSVQAIVGAQVFITSPGRRIAYKVVGARQVGDGAELQLNMDSRIGEGRVSGVADFRVKTPTPFHLQRYGYYEGARLVNADGSAEYRIDEVRSGSAAMINRTAHPEATGDTLATQFEEGSWFKVYDYGVGDEVVWPYAVSVTRTAPNTYEITAPCPVEITLPDGAGAVPAQ